MKNWVNIKKPEMKKARIEIIPMIDTIFFLLVFFMFTSLSMVSMKGMGVSLPKNSTDDTSKPPPKLVITVDQDGNYFVNKDKTTLQALPADLQSVVNGSPNAVIIVNVYKRQNTQTLISVMDAVNDVHIPGSTDSPPVAIASQGVSADGTPLQ